MAGDIYQAEGWGQQQMWRRGMRFSWVFWCMTLPLDLPFTVISCKLQAAGKFHTEPPRSRFESLPLIHVCGSGRANYAFAVFHADLA